MPEAMQAKGLAWLDPASMTTRDLTINKRFTVLDWYTAGGEHLCNAQHKQGL